MKISIIIPTYNRPVLFKECLESCINQDLIPFEIIIGDDSSNSETTELVKHYLNNDKQIAINYHKHDLPKKQAGNVNFLIAQATGDYVCLIHDDDYLLSNCLFDLSRPFKENSGIDASFGKQYLVDMQGYIDKDASDSLNKTYFRSAKYVSNKLISFHSGLVQQFPNNGYLIKSHIIKKYHYSTDIDYVGDAGDFFFGFNLGLKGFNFYFINTYTAAYRIGNDKVGNRLMANSSLRTFFILKNTPIVTVEVKKDYNQQLNRLAPIALSQAINRKEIDNALKIFFSKNHFVHFLSLGGLKRSLLLVKLMMTK